MSMIDTIKTILAERSISFHGAYISKTVVVFWISPFETLEYSIGYFENSTEADEWIKMRKHPFELNKFEYCVVVNERVIDKTPNFFNYVYNH